MNTIEKKLHAHHADLRARGVGPSISHSVAPNSLPRPDPSGQAFATVNSVITGSPAADAGLRTGDQIVQFGSADSTNHDKLNKVASLVQSNEGVMASHLHIELSAWLTETV